MKGTGGSEEVKSRECWMRRGMAGEKEVKGELDEEERRKRK